MTPDLLRRIFAEAGPDFSAAICEDASIADLDPKAIEALRQRWHGRAKVDAILANRMYEACIREGKPLPDFTHTDEWQVSVALHGQIVDEYFVKFLAHIGRETKQSFGLQDFLVFDLVHREQMVPAHLRPTLRRLREIGLVEVIGRGRGMQYLLARRFYSAIGQRGAYTRRRGLDNESNKQLLLRHLSDSGAGGCPALELQQVLPAVSRTQLKRLLGQLKAEGQARMVGATKGARWFAVAQKQAPGVGPGASTR